METIVISAVNIVEGGALSVLHDCLRALANSGITERYSIIALVNSRKIIPEYANIKYLEYPKAKKHYLYRLYYEYFAFYLLSKKIRPKLWLSLHDMSPKVKASVQAVYMHNPTPFYKPTIIDWKFLPINAVWAYLYKYVYRINIHSNKYLVVQQDWLRREFSKMFKFDKEKIIVARPISVPYPSCKHKNESRISDVFHFFYPAFPRVFKNFEVICEAAKILEKEGVTNLRVVLTIDGTENKYSQYLLGKYGDIKLIDFIGLVDKTKMEELYDNTDCLIFPSKLETWGLPLSEFKPYGRPILAANLPYAHESVAGANKVLFFDPNDAFFLANAMKNLAIGDDENFIETKEMELSEPHCSSWDSLFQILLG